MGRIHDGIIAAEELWALKLSMPDAQVWQLCLQRFGNQAAWKLLSSYYKLRRAIETALAFLRHER
jgi:hypothetical protein